LIKKHGALISPKDVIPSRDDFEIIGTFNAGVARFGGEVVLLLRVAERVRPRGGAKRFVPVYNHESGAVGVKEFSLSDPRFDFSDPRVISGKRARYLTSMSHLRLARSRDGLHFTVDEKPTILPFNEYHAFGIEDARITRIGDEYYIVFSSVSREKGVVANLMKTRDFETFSPLGVIFHPDNKDVALFPQKINGYYYALHRPSPAAFGDPSVWVAKSPDLVCWGDHRFVFGVRQNGWENGRVGASLPPFLTDEGWVEIYHSATRDDKYSVGAALLDKNDPAKVLARTARPLFAPTRSYEKNGFFSKVVFPCGGLFEDGKVKIYYGAADTYLAYLEMDLRDVFAALDGGPPKFLAPSVLSAAVAEERSS
jgi:predicted GH43/DUF377 family glycosyl hydrolase